MKVNQISSMLNEVFGGILGEDGLFAADLSNVVDAGRVITGSTDVFGDNFDNYAGKIIDKVGRTVFWDRVYTAEDLGLWRDSFEYGSVLEKIRCEVGDYTDNCEWKLTDASGNGTPDYNDSISDHIQEMFKFYPATVQAKYFNAKTTFKTTISITRRQLKSAFNSAADLARFIGMIEQRVRTKMEISKNQLQKMVIANLIGEHIAQGKQVIDLAELYRTETGNSAGGFADAMINKDKCRYIAQKMTFFREMMAEPSKLYSATGTFYNHTPVELSRMIVLADLDSGLRFNVYGDTYNEEFVKLNNYKTVPFWQTSGDSIGADSLADRSGINVTTSNGNVVVRNNIIGVLFDRDAAMICNEAPDVRTQYNPDGNFTNFFYCADCSYYNDFDENCIVFVWGESDSGLENSLTLAKGTATGNTVVSAVSPAAGSGDTFQYLVSTAPKAVSIGDEPPTSYASLTVGAAGTGTDITAGAGKYIEVIRVNDSVVTGYGNKKVTTAVVK